MSHAPAALRPRLVLVIVPAVLAVAGSLVLVQPAAASGAPIARPTVSGSFAGPAGHAAAKPVYFHTLPPGAKLPTGAQCAKLVNASPEPEDKAANKAYNKRIGHGVGSKFFGGGDSPKAQKLIAPLITGDFTGTTIDILRWAACKWGIDQDIVFAQAAVESWWQQDTEGDFGTDAADCPPGHRQLDKQGECAQSWGILQNRYPYEVGAWPALINSTAMNADTAYGIWRACFDGYETWLNTVTRGGWYKAGNAWGCVGRWFAGRWLTPAALGYIKKVKQYLKEKVWLKPDFRQMG